MDASIRKTNGLLGVCPPVGSHMLLVLTKAQLFNAAYNPRSSVNGDPMAHKPNRFSRSVSPGTRYIPRPGGRNFMLNILSYIFCADACAFILSQPRLCCSIQRRCML